MLEHCTLVIITHRADARFERAVSCRKWFEKCLVIDTSESRLVSQALANATNCTVVHKPGLIRDFAKIRNDALTQVCSDWVLFLDSDEWIEVATAEQLAKILKTTTATGVWMSRVDWFAGQQLRHGESGKQAILRLVKKDQVRFIHPVHEVAQVKGNTTISSGVIFHQPHLSLRSFIEKVSWYSSLIGKQQAQLSKLQLITQLLLYPPLKFLANYILRLGFLDGYPGLIYAVVMSLHSAWVRVYAYENCNEYHKQLQCLSIGMSY